MSDAPALELVQLTRTYVTEVQELTVLHGVDLTLRSGELVALVGPSGSGKSSLLHAAGLLEHPTSGDVRVAGRSALDLPDAERTRLRRRHIGFVYQFHHLLPEFSALDNVAMPQLIAGATPGHANGRAMELLTLMGLAERATHRPTQLSGGEQQRVAVARAVANRPTVLLADEPTGNLDPRTSQSVFAYLRSLVKAEGVAGLVATHNLDLAREMDRVVTLRDGILVDADESSPAL